MSLDVVECFGVPGVSAWPPNGWRRSDPIKARLTGADRANDHSKQTARRRDGLTIAVLSGSAETERAPANREDGMSPYRILAAACVAAGLVPFAAAAESAIKIGFPIPLSGPAAVYGGPISKGGEM